VGIVPRSISVETLSEKLRHSQPPVVSRIQDERLILNPRTLHESEESFLLETVTRALNN